MNLIKNLFLYISAFIPMYVLVLLKLVIDLINENLYINVLNVILLVGLIGLIAIGGFGLLLNIFMVKDKSIEVEIIDKKNLTDQHFLGYFSLFVLFAVSFDLSKVNMFVVFIVILILIGIVYIKNKLFYINPFLNILGFNFYDISYKEKGSQEIRSAKIFFKGDLQVKTNYFVILKNEHFSFIDYKKMKRKK